MVKMTQVDSEANTDVACCTLASGRSDVIIIRLAVQVARFTPGGMWMRKHEQYSSKAVQSCEEGHKSRNHWRLSCRGHLSMSVVNEVHRAGTKTSISIFKADHVGKSCPPLKAN